MADRAHAVDTLNNLIQTCRDGERGFRAAAERVDDPDARALFADYSSERREFASQLQEEVRRLGGSPRHGDSIAGELRRTWMEIKDDVGRDDRLLIAEAERGEDVAVARYQQALDGDLPPSSRILVERQYRQVQHAHDRVRALESHVDREP